jgi:hypothetical protein
MLESVVNGGGFREEELRPGDWRLRLLDPVVEQMDLAASPAQICISSSYVHLLITGGGDQQPWRCLQLPSPLHVLAMVREQPLLYLGFASPAQLWWWCS